MNRADVVTGLKPDALLDRVQVLAKSIAQCLRQHHSPVLLTFAAAHRDLPPIEIEILHAYFQALLQAQPSSAQARRGELSLS